MYFGNGLFDYWWNFFVCYGSKLGNHFAHNLREFGVACSEKLEVNQWIALDIRMLSSQSERARKTLSTVLVYTKWCFNGVKTQQLGLERGFVKHRLNRPNIPPAWEIKEGDRLYTSDTKTSLARIEPIRLLKAYLNYGNQMKLPLRWTADRSREGGYLLICYFL